MKRAIPWQILNRWSSNGQSKFYSWFMRSSLNLHIHWLRQKHKKNPLSLIELSVATSVVNELEMKESKPMTVFPVRMFDCGIEAFFNSWYMGGSLKLQIHYEWNNLSPPAPLKSNFSTDSTLHFRAILFKFLLINMRQTK